jgi:hypothetical protein
LYISFSLYKVRGARPPRGGERSPASARFVVAYHYISCRT